MTSQERANRIADIVLECNRLAKVVDRLATYCPLCDGPCGHLAASENDHGRVGCEVAPSRVNDSRPDPSEAAKQPDRTTPW